MSTGTHFRSPHLEEFGRRLRQLREDCHLKLREIAGGKGFSYSTISAKENGVGTAPPEWEFVEKYVNTCREENEKKKEKKVHVTSERFNLAIWHKEHGALETILEVASRVSGTADGRAAGTPVPEGVERPYEDIAVAMAELPSETAGLVGRADQLAALAGQLAPASAAGEVVAVVVGLPGVGKTALAIEAGRAAVRHGWFSGGVLVIDLRGYDEAWVRPRQALEALLRALRAPMPVIAPAVDERAAVDELAGLYRLKMAEMSGPVLLIADNASTEAQVRPLLPGIGHKVLVTSRDNLAALGARLVDVEVLSDEEAIILLDNALRVARPDDKRITADRQAASRLARDCGGLPLALQIIAYLLIQDPVLSVAELADELAVETERLERLRYDDGSGPNAPSVAAAFELSYRRLDDDAARLFRLLPVNPRPDASTEAIAALADLTAAETRRDLTRLARAHLIEPALGRAGRWRMHDLMHLYAQWLSDTHAETDKREQARDRLFGYYLAFAGDHQADGDWDALETDINGFMGVLTWARDRHRHQAIIDLARLLNQFFFIRTHTDEATLVRTGEARLVRAGAVQAAVDLGNKSDLLWSVQQLAMLDGRTGRPSEARAGFTSALQLARELSDLQAERSARRELGLLSQKAGQLAEALTEYQQAFVLAEQLDDIRALFPAVLDLAVVNRLLGRPAEAGQYFERALRLARELGEPWALGVVLSDYGDFLREAGDRARARTLLEEAIQVSQTINYAYRLGKCHQYLAKLQEQEGDTTSATVSYRASLTYFERAGAAELKEVPADLLALETDPEIVKAVRAFAGATRQEEAQTYLQRYQDLLFTDAADKLLSVQADQVRQNADQETEKTRSVRLKIRLHALRSARHGIFPKDET